MSSFSVKGASVMLKIVLAIVPFLSFAGFAHCAQPGSLQKINNENVLFLKGSAYQRGFQHGQTLKSQIKKNLLFVDRLNINKHPRFKYFMEKFDTLVSHIPQKITEELQGLSDGSGFNYQDLLVMNLIPELVHCSGITASFDSTKDNSLYHVRVLDYRLGKGLQNTAVTIVAKPDDGNGYLSVTYAGFIGCITGMNEAKLSIGEIGGLGYDQLNGIPMSFLMKLCLENSASLEEAELFYKKANRTGEYYYVLGDGNTQESKGVYATSSQIHFINPGETYALLCPNDLPEFYGTNGQNDKFFLANCQLEKHKYYTELKDQNQNCVGLIFSQLKHVITLTGYPRPYHFDALTDGLKELYGTIDAKALMDILKRPNASRKTNLHTAIFHPKSLTAYIAHAESTEKPAYLSSYHKLNLQKLLSLLD